MGGSEEGPGPIVSVQESPTPENVLELRFTPGDFVIPSVAKPIGLGYQGTTAYYDLIVQAIAFVNHGDRALTVTEVSLEVFRGPVLLQRQTISVRELQRATGNGAALAGSGFESALDVHYSASTLLGDVPITPSAKIEPGAAALVDDCYVLTRGLPSLLRVTAVALDDAGREVRGVGELPVRFYTLKNEYLFPVEAGHWWVVAFPGLRGHHRWTQCTEHSLDITKVDERGSWAGGEVDDWNQGLVPEWEDWHAFDSMVLAAADGKVVKVNRDDEFSLADWGVERMRTSSATCGASACSRTVASPRQARTRWRWPGETTSWSSTTGESTPCTCIWPTARSSWTKAIRSCKDNTSPGSGGRARCRRSTCTSRSDWAMDRRPDRADAVHERHRERTSQSEPHASTVHAARLLRFGR